MNLKLKIFISVVVVNILILNVLLGGLLWKSQQPKPTEIASGAETTVAQQMDTCGKDCQEYIDTQLAKVSVGGTPISLPTATSTPSKPVVVPTQAKVTSVSYVTVPGSGNSSSQQWTDLPGTDMYFNQNDYSGLQNIYFEANVRLLNGNGQAYFRLFDVTHGIGVQGSEIATSSQSSVPVESGQVSFWQGKILLRVQAKSLTADTAIFDNGRFRITTKN